MRTFLSDILEVIGFIWLVFVLWAIFAPCQSFTYTLPFADITVVKWQSWDSCKADNLGVIQP